MCLNLLLSPSFNGMFSYLKYYWSVVIKLSKYPIDKQLRTAHLFLSSLTMEFISKYLMYNFHLVCNIQLQIVDNAKYLGLTISKNLSWNNHVNNITKKANSTLAFLRRNIRNCPQRAIMMSLASWRLCCRVGQLRSCSSVVTLALGS
jgi:hypothetical protein